jgi:hypothetical protein
MAKTAHGYPVRKVRVSSLRHGHTPDDRRQNRGRDPRSAPPIVYNRHGKVTDGNDRLLGARRKGQTHIDAIYVPDSRVGGCCFRALAQGKKRLATRLAQRWIKIQLGVLVPA